MEKINLANLPTPIMKLERTSNELNKNIYIKRDDYTGTEISGNKIRKLEYAIAEALRENCDTIITTGALQSNHCRATAAVCAKLGLECHLILKGEPKEIEGNFFLDYILGANVHAVEAESADEKMKELFRKLEEAGKKPYLIPMGASNPIGTYGYIEAYKEILQQEQEMGITFDMIVVPVGSGGTYAGLWYGNHQNKDTKKIYGFSVSESSDYFTEIVMNILKQLDEETKDFHSVFLNDSYVGEGYGLATREELEFYYQVGKKEGIVFDPCYTGKAFRGLVHEIEKGCVQEQNILFIHTGGLMGWTNEQRDMIHKIAQEEVKNEI